MRSIASTFTCRGTKRRCSSTSSRDDRDARGCGMIIGRQQDVTVAATAVMERTSDPRLREIMLSLVKHLHGFVRGVKRAQAEFREGAGILVELGKQTTDPHNEMILIAGSLGVSSLVCLLNN